MSIFNNLFGYNLTNNNVDKTPVKVKAMLKALDPYIIFNGNSIYRILIPKRLVKKYNKAVKRLENGENLTPMDKTRIYGYLNPKYHAATSPRKRIR